MQRWILARLSRVAALRVLVSRLQARTAESGRRRVGRPASRRPAFRGASGTGGRCGCCTRRWASRPGWWSRGAESIARIADAVAALPQALQAMADRRAAQARQAEQERAVRQQEIAAGVSRFRDRYADRRRQEVEAARDDLARRAVATWGGAHHARCRASRPIPV